MRIRSDLPVAPEVFLTVSTNGRIFRGTVRYCLAVQSWFEIGVELSMLTPQRSL